MKNLFGCVIQFFVVAVSLVIGGLLSDVLFDSQPLLGIFAGIFTVLAYFLLYAIGYSIKAIKDPDVQAASSLGMSITRFHHYQRLFDEWQECMDKNGIDSSASQKKFEEIFKQVKNPNEWRRYSDWRYQQTCESMSKIYERFKNMDKGK